VAFLSGHLGFPFPSPVLFRQLGERFRRAVLSFAEANGIPWVKFGKDEAKLEVMAPYLARQASTGRSGVAAIRPKIVRRGCGRFSGRCPGRAWSPQERSQGRPWGTGASSRTPHSSTSATA
jgi:hypothetical protein